MEKKRWMVTVLSLVVAMAAFGGFWLRLQGKSWGMPKRKSEAVVVFSAEPEASMQRPITVTLTIQSKNVGVNAVGLYLRYDPTYLELTDMNTQASFCQFYPEKKFDNQLGTITLSCGAPHPGFKGETTMMTLTFRPKQPGSTTIYTLDNSQILASDGQGSNILTDYPQQVITIFNNL
jgi:hypothetical protein